MRLKEKAKSIGVKLTRTVDGKRVAKTKNQLLRDIRNKDDSDRKKLLMRLVKLKKDMGNWNTSSNYDLKPQTIKRGSKLWQDLVKYFAKRGVKKTAIVRNEGALMNNFGVNNNSQLNQFFRYYTGANN